MKVPRPNRSKLQRVIKRRDKQRRNWCRRCPFSAPGGRCLDTTIRSGRCGDWVFYLLPGGKQCRRRWVRPKDPLTPAQVRNRARLAAASRKYSAGLTDQEQDACIAAGAKARSRRRLGQSGPLTGQQYSVRQGVRSECRRKSAEYRNSVLRCFQWNATDSRRGVASWSSGMGRCQCEGQRYRTAPGPSPLAGFRHLGKPCESGLAASKPNLLPRTVRRLPPASPADTLVAPPESPRSTSDRRSEVLRGDSGGIRLGPASGWGE